MDFLGRLFDTSDFPARWNCGLWTAGHGWLHILSDLGIWSAYFAIPLVLLYFVLRRRDLPFRKIFVLFGAFILLCGSTHLMEATIFWWPAYRLAGLLKLITALVSWTTVIALIPVIPQFLAMRAPDELEREIVARKQAEQRLLELNAQLERRVSERTKELSDAVTALRAERELLGTTLTSIGDGVIVTDQEGRVTFLNSVAEGLTGWATADARGEPLDRVFHIIDENSRAPVANPALRALQGRAIVGLASSTVLLAKDGTERPIDDSAAPIRGDGQGVSGAVLVFRDVTERRRREAELEERERQFHTLAESLPQLAWMAGPDGHIFWYNRRWYDYTGTTLAQMEGWGWQSVHDPNELPRVLERWQGALVRGEPWEDIFPLRRHDGEFRPHLSRAFPIKDDAGRVVRWVGTNTDITEVKRVQDQLRASEERLRLALTASRMVAWEYDADADRLTASDNRAELYGLPPGSTLENVEQSFPLVHSDDIGQHRAAVRKAIREGMGYVSQFRILRPDNGVAVWIEERGQTVRGEPGKPRRLVGVSVDITERKRAEQEKAELLARLDTLIAHAPVGIALFDPELRYVTLNQRAAAVDGLPLEEHLGKTVSELLPDVGAKVEEALRQVRATGTPLTGLELAGAASAVPGQQRHWHASYFPVRDGAGKVLGLGAIALEITDRKRMEEQLRASERRFQQFMDNSPATAFMKDEDGYYVFVNRLLERKFNRPAADWVGKTDADLFCAAEAEQYRKNDQAVLESGRTIQVEEQVENGDGAHHYLSFKFPVLDWDGRRLVGGMALDITERKRAEQEAQEGRRILQAIMQNVPEGITVADAPDVTIRVVSRYGLELVGRPPETLVGIPSRQHPQAWNIYHEDGTTPAQPDELPLSRAVQRGEVVVNEEWVICRPDEQRIPILCNAGPIRDERGAVVGGVTTWRDISDRKQAMDALRASEQRFRLLAAASNDGLWEIDLATGRVWWNEAYDRLYGPRPADTDHSSAWWAERLHPDDQERVERSMCEAIAGENERWSAEYRFRRADGAYAYVLDRGLFFRNEAGQAVRMVGSMLDLTDRKRVEELLREADRRKDEFIATLAHELRNPLAPIRNAVQIVRAKAPEIPELLWARDVIERQVGQMARLLDDLLDVSRITRSKLALRTSRVTLTAVVDSAVEISRPLIDGGGHELTVALPSEPIYLDADPVRLAQVFANLLNNAAKYTERSGHIVLRAGRRGGEVFVSVQDDGIGIVREMLPRLFQMFSQATPALQRSQGGLGIGLSLVKGLVELHGGSVKARSDGPGKGSVFTVRLPIALAPPVLPTHSEAEVPSLEGCKIVVADDNHDAADSLAMMLKIMGNNVRTASDGQEALEVVEQFRPEVVLLDIGMPRVNSYDAARRIRAQPWGKGIFLVALTGWGQEEDKRRSREAGFDLHLVKPAEPAAIEKVLAARPQRASV